MSVGVCVSIGDLGMSASYQIHDIGGSVESPDGDNDGDGDGVRVKGDGGNSLLFVARAFAITVIVVSAFVVAG